MGLAHLAHRVEPPLVNPEKNGEKLIIHIYNASWEETINGWIQQFGSKMSIQFLTNFSVEYSGYSVGKKFQ